MKPQPAILMNVIALYAIAGVLAAAFAMQFALGELPCPLCLLQRVSMFGVCRLGLPLLLRSPQA